MNRMNMNVTNNASFARCGELHLGLDILRVSLFAISLVEGLRLTEENREHLSSIC